jgi:iron complex outermembrane receptor protein
MPLRLLASAAAPVLLATLGLCVSAPRARAAGPAQPGTLATIIVTGTHAQDRTAADSLKPIDVLTPADLAATGAPDLDTALRTLLPSFNFPQPSQLGTTDATLPAQLRGLAPDETLVLIDGKRQHTTSIVNVAGPNVGRGSSPVDLSAIPISAIARIEVLRDGAAAQYGSDAIAGVINIILKGGADHGAASVTRGQRAHGEGDTWQGGADGGFALGRRGWMHLAANYVNQDPTNHIGPDVRFPADPRYAEIDAHYGLPKSLARQATVNAQYDLGEHAQLYAFGVYNARDVAAGGAWQSLSEYASISPPAAARYPQGFLPMEHSAIRDDSTAIGLRGDALGWHYDLSVSSGGNHAKMATTNTYNYWLGAASPTAVYDGTLAIRQDIFNADFRRSFDTRWYAPLTVAWGLADQRTRFAIKPGEAASYFGGGAVGSFGLAPGGAGAHARRNAAAYVDLETSFSAALSAELAARRERYSDFGNTTSWSLSARYAFTPALAVRGSASTGFRAPSLQQTFYASTSIEYLNNAQGFPVPYVIGTFPVSNPAAVALGAKPLQPERSRNFSAGLVWSPVDGPYVALDLYQITIDRRISLSGDLVGPAVTTYLASVGIAGVTGGRFFTNAADTRTRGADLTASWTVPFGVTRLKLTGGLNDNRTDILAIAPNPPQLGLAGLVLPMLDRTDQGLISAATPRTKAFIAADWRRGHWGARAQLTRYGAWQVLGDTPAADDTYGARVLLDLAATYHLKRWAFTLGGNNVTNTYPEKNNAMNSFLGIIPYPFSSPFGFSGAYWYGSAAYRW